MKPIDALTITRIVATVVTLFNLNTIQEKKLSNYVKDNQYKWISELKRKEEVETLIKSEARNILGK